MDIPGELLRLLRCPRCRAGLTVVDDGLQCDGADPHRFDVEDGFLTFDKPPTGKYDPRYAARYAALWAFGYETRHRGHNESLYRCVSSLVAESLAERAGAVKKPLIVDCGCGVGRCTVDGAALAPSGMVLGIDGSLAMLERAEEICHGRSPVTVELGEYGFQTLEIAGRGAGNVYLLRGDVEQLPVADACADVALSVNIIDRLPRGPEHAFRECRRILEPGGSLVFTDPLNWTDEHHWKAYSNSADILKLIESCGFTIRCWFDGLVYHEVLDARESVESFSTLVVRATRI